MAMFKNDPVRPDPYAKFEHETPTWFRDAKLGIFVHWGPYSVPAWAEPIGPLGTFDEDHWFRHNPYSEWYYNTIRIDVSPAQRHQQETYGGADYDDFLDAWKAESFDADDVMRLVASTGARYFVPTSKHHDGVTLWDAPGTGDRNTVHRGPHRDLIAELRDAAEAHGVRFGLYYSGGLDWWFDEGKPIHGPIGEASRPVDRAYSDYAYDHVVDLIDKYRPAVLWGDIEWPDAGKDPAGKSLVDVFERFYAAVPDGVVNDRFGETHWDFRTSEYEEGRSSEGDEMWENCRGIGFSFAHNRLEDESHSLDGPGAIRHFVDVVARGGNLLLNIGLTAAGEVTPVQRATLEALGAWNAAHGEAIFGSRPLDPAIASPSDDPWVRWTRTGDVAHVFIDAPAGSHVSLPADPARLALRGDSAETAATSGELTVVVPESDIAGPARLSFDIR